jgi:hypothetical protein
MAGIFLSRIWACIRQSVLCSFFKRHVPEKLLPPFYRLLFLISIAPFFDIRGS